MPTEQYTIALRTNTSETFIIHSTLIYITR